MRNKKRKTGAMVFRTLITVMLVGVLLGTVQVAYGQVCSGTQCQNGCVQQRAPKVTCEANDIRLSAVTNVVITDPCARIGDVATFSADFTVETTASNRYDIGLYFSTDGDPNNDGALSGGCSINTLPTSPSPFLNLDGDFCGDISKPVPTTLTTSVTVTAICVDKDEDGYLDLPWCASWDNNSNTVCNSPLDAYPGAPSKCNCSTSTGFNVPVPVPPKNLVVVKTADPLTVNEPGGNVTFNVQVLNPSTALSVTLNSLADSIYQNITTPGHDGIISTTCSLPQTLQPGDGVAGGTDTFTCSFTAFVSGQPGDVTNTVTAVGIDSRGREVSGQDDATVRIADVGSQISLDKTADPAWLYEPGGSVVYTVVVKNLSPVDNITITSLTDQLVSPETGNIVSLDSNNGTCAVSFTLTPGQSYTCSFSTDVTGVPGYIETDKVVATGTDDDGKPVSAEDTALVEIRDAPSSIRVTKVAFPDQFDEPGGITQYIFTVFNDSTVDTVTISSLLDNVLGELLAECISSGEFNPVLSPGASSVCKISRTVTGNAGSSVVNVVTVSGEDDDGYTRTASATETVSIVDVRPKISVTKTADPTSVPETGGDVTFTVQVKNESTAEFLTLTSLVDDKFGDLAGQGTCTVPQTLAPKNEPGDTYICIFTEFLSSDGWTAHTNVVTATASDDEGNSATATDDETVTFTPQPLTVTKTANTFFTRTHNWTISKVSDGEYWNFIGDPATAHQYTVSVDKTTTDSDWAVSGNITITNKSSITDVVISGVSDVISPSIPATVNCPVLFPYTLASGGTLTCSYGASLPDASTRTNTATVTTTVPALGGTATVNMSFDSVIPSVIGPESINVTDTNGLSWTASDDASWTYTKDFTCSYNPADYTQGVDSDSYLNTATITETAQTASATVKVNCYAPVLSKTAAGTYNERHEWDVTKTVSTASQSAFAGDTVSYEWTVVVREQTTEDNFAVSGEITIQNPNPKTAMTVSLADAVNGTPAILDCLGTLSVPAGSSATCGYTASPGDKTALTNTATAALNGIAFVANANVGWTANVIRASAILDDDKNPVFPMTITEGGTWTYTEQYTCSTDKNAYDVTTHKYTFGESNTATLTSGDFSDSSGVSTAVDCYVPVISKTANGTFDEVHDWEVFKTGSTAQKKFAGQSASFTWTVRVEETTHGENYLVTGGITVVNPNPEDDLTVIISDVMSDGSSLVTIGPCTGGTWSSPNLTVPPGGTATCEYIGPPKGDLNAFAGALPATVTMSVMYPYEDGPAYFPLITISGDDALNGYYEGWCVDTDHVIYENTNYTANVFSSYESVPAGLLEHPENLDLVNWIMNQEFVGKSAGGSLGNYTYSDVQYAIWTLIDEQVSTSGLYDLNTTRAAQIVAGARANGEGFTPTCNDYVAVILQPVSLENQVISIAQVTFASLGLDCTESNSVTAWLNQISFTASAEILWTVNKINETVQLDDTQNPAWPITVSGDGIFTYTDPDGYTCPGDPAAYAGDGIAPVYTDTNTATITYTGGSKSATASTTVTCYGPVVTKTAATEWRQKYDWTITKTADPASHTGFAGDSFTSGFDVFVDQTVTDYGFVASGTITIKNPSGSPGNMTANVADMVSGGFAATVDCDPATAGNQTSVTVAVNATQTCSYTVGLPDNASRVNTATGTFNNIGFPATANVVFGAPIIEGYPTINVTDNVQGALGSASEDKHFTYNRNFSCSTNKSDYTNYADSDTYPNTATINETGLSGGASVTVNCYIPEISKTAAGNYDERHEWDVTKTVLPISQSAFIGDTVSYEWTVVVTEQVFEENFVVGGTITVVNHNPEDAMTVALSDVLSDSTATTITACTGDADLSDGLTIAAGGTSVCSFTALLSYDTVANAPTNNTATAVLNGISYSASDPIEWAVNLIRANATLDDDQNPAFPLTLTDGGSWTYAEQYTCSTDKAAYDATTHKYTYGESNTATLTSGDFSDSSAASTSVDCYVPSISKDANGSYDEVHDWMVFKSVNPASQTAFAGEKKNFTWTVRVEETTHGESYLVTGTITVVNPNPEDALTVALSDMLDDGSVATIGPCTGGIWTSPNLIVPAGGTATCDYSVIPEGEVKGEGISTVFDAALPNQVTMQVTYPYEGGPSYFPITTISNDGILNGTYEGWCADIDHTIANNTPYEANVYSSYETLPAGIIEKAYNLDLVNWIINQGFVGKPAGDTLGNYTYGDVQRAIWELIEDNGTSNTSGLGSWNQTRVNQIKAAAVANGEGFVPTCGDYVAVILQPVGGQQLITIAQVTFASLGIPCATNNIATAVLNGVEFPASAKILWTVNKINETASLDDDQKLDWPVTVSADTTFTYQDPQGYTCSTDPAAYTNGYYQYTESNTAVLTFSAGSDTATASTAVKCYAPVVSKIAAGAYDERHEWDVEKSVTPTSQNAFAGDTVSYEWTVTVVESVFEENFVASGTISVKNPRPDDGSMVVKLTDVLSDGFVATITGCTGGTWNATNKTVAVPPNTTAVCNFTANLTYNDDASAPTLNTVTVELMAGTTHLTATASDAIEWAANIIRSSTTLDDDQNPALPLNITDGGTWTYSESYTCSTNPANYGSIFKYTFDENNTAIVTSGDERDRDSASTEVNCHWPQIALTKTGDALSKIGDDITYTITLINNTPAVVGLRDLTCSISDTTISFTKNSVTLASGASDTSTSPFTIPAGAADPFVNTASATCAPLNSPSITANASASWDTNLFQPAVEIIKTGPEYATSGDTITFSFTINNLSSADSPNLILDTISDDVLGDLADDAPAACDELAPGASCTFTVDYTVPDVGLQAYGQTNIVTVHYHPDGFPNDVTDNDNDGSNSHTVTLVPRGQLTDSSLCPLPDNQFRLNYHLVAAPNVYRLQASNPGQYYMNAFYYGAPGTPFTMTIQIPYPFVTQEGAGNPIQVHDGTALTDGSCFNPNPSLAGFTILTQAMDPDSSAGNQIITPEDYTTKQLGELTTVTVSGVVPTTGLVYVTIHLDYGLKKTDGWKQPGTSTLIPDTSTSVPDVLNQTGFGSGPVTIHGYEVYDFARTVGGDTSTTTPSSYNEIKKFAGFLGFVSDLENGNPMANVKVVIYNPSNAELATVYTDEDGYYMFPYKHTSKAATYTIKLPDYSLRQSVSVKANGFAAVNFEVP